MTQESQDLCEIFIWWHYHKEEQADHLWCDALQYYCPIKAGKWQWLVNSTLSLREALASGVSAGQLPHNRLGAANTRHSALQLNRY